MNSPLVEPKSTQVSSVSITFCPVDCVATSISSMESNAGLLGDRREIYALDHNPTQCMSFIFKVNKSLSVLNIHNLSNISKLSMRVKQFIKKIRSYVDIRTECELPEHQIQIISTKINPPTEMSQFEITQEE